MEKEIINNKSSETLAAVHTHTHNIPLSNLDLKSKDVINENIKKIAEIFPNVIVESEKGKAIDFDALKQELSEVVVEGNKEKYQLTWPGKKEAILEANTPTTKTLRPLKEKSVDFDNTQNIYIEGDNLEALKILQESYLNKIKCIYIDPPYNTGHDFIYNDKFVNDDELKDSKQVDENNNKLVSNLESNGKFHSAWLNMIYPRLKIARNLLKDDGLIFISIDDNELNNLKKVMDEIYGERNFVANFIRNTGSTRNMAVGFDVRHDYVLIYAKDINNMKLNQLKKNTELYFNYDNDENGKWSTQDFSVRTGGYEYTIPSIDGNIKFKKRWLKSIEDTKIMMGGTPQEKFDEIYKRAKFIKEKNWYVLGEFVFKGPSNVINRKKYASKTATLINNTLFNDIGSNKGASKVLNNLLHIDNKIFDTPKPLELLKYIEYISLNDEDIILDFFSGSATTAHALLEFNLQYNKNNKYIMVQLDESLYETLKKATGDNINNIKNTINYLESLNEEPLISRIGIERIKKANENIRKQTKANIDYGFRVYKVDSSNMNDVYYEPSKISQEQLNLFESNVKEDRSAEDLLTQIILDLGLTLDLPIEEKEIKNNKVFYVAGNSLVACLDKEVDLNIIEEICKVEPLKIVFREEAFRTDAEKINFKERIKRLSPHTEVNIL